MDWIKLYTRKWIWGSGRTMTPEKRGVWVDILALAAETKLRDGTLRHDIGQPMTRDYIAGVLMVDRPTLDSCLEAFKSDINADDGASRIRIWSDGTIEITNWHKYQELSDKEQAKRAAIEKGKETKRRHEAATDALVRAVNKLNSGLSERRYQITPDGKILDTKTGEVKPLEDAPNS